MFRIAHYWATHIDVAEYCEILEKVYSRITVKKIIRSDGSCEMVLPRIEIDIFQEKEIDDEDDGFLSCDEDEQS